MAALRIATRNWLSRLWFAGGRSRAQSGQKIIKVVGHAPYQPANNCQVLRIARVEFRSLAAGGERERAPGGGELCASPIDRCCHGERRAHLGRELCKTWIAVDQLPIFGNRHWFR